MIDIRRELKRLERGKCYLMHKERAERMMALADVLEARQRIKMLKDKHHVLSVVMSARPQPTERRGHA
jgi:hypothetical protein